MIWPGSPRLWPAWPATAAAERGGLLPTWDETTARFVALLRGVAAG